MIKDFFDEMSVGDFSALITIIVTFCAFGSSVLNTALNNWHQRSMKKLEYDHLKQSDLEKRRREVFEGYISAASSYVHLRDPKSLQSFGEYAGLALYYVPANLRDDMIQLEQLIDSERFDYNRSKEEPTVLLNKIILQMQKSSTKKCS